MSDDGWSVVSDGDTIKFGSPTPSESTLYNHFNQKESKAPKGSSKKDGENTKDVITPVENTKSNTAIVPTICNKRNVENAYARSKMGALFGINFSGLPLSQTAQAKAQSDTLVIHFRFDPHAPKLYHSVFIKSMFNFDSNPDSWSQMMFYRNVNIAASISTIAKEPMSLSYLLLIILWSHMVQPVDQQGSEAENFWRQARYYAWRHLVSAGHHTYFIGWIRGVQPEDVVNSHLKLVEFFQGEAAFRVNKDGSMEWINIRYAKSRMSRDVRDVWNVPTFTLKHI